MLHSSSNKAILTSNINLTDSDGKSLRLLSLAELLNIAGFNVTLIVSRCNSVAAEKFPIIETKTPLRDTLHDSLLKKILHYSRESIDLLSFYSKLLFLGDHYDIIVTSLVGPETDSLLACILSKIKRIPFVYDYDDPSPEIRITFFRRSSNDPRVRLSLFTRNILIQSASLVLTAADTVKHKIVEDFGTRRVSVWYNLPRTDSTCVSLDKEYLRQKLGFGNRCFIVSYLGRVPTWFIQRLRDIVLAFAHEFKHDKDVLFLMIGGGKWEEQYREMIRKLGFEDRILITGMIPRQNALEYLMVSDLSCIPSDLNPAASNITPTKLFEAMELGIPILIPRSANYVQILGDDGIYFDGSSRDFVRRVRWCWENKEKLEKTSSNLKTRFRDQYTWEQKALELKSVITSLLRIR